MLRVQDRSAVYPAEAELNEDLVESEHPWAVDLQDSDDKFYKKVSVIILVVIFQVVQKAY